MIKSTLLYIALALTSATMAAQTAVNDAKQTAAAVDRRYADLHTLKMDFTEIYSGAGRTRKESGTLWLKRPGKMRWEYTQPREKLFISDGKSAYFYVPGERQARKASLKTIDDLRSPLRFLLGKAKLRKELDRLRIPDAQQPMDPANTLLSGVPKRLADRISNVLFEVSPAAEIERIVIEELDGTITEFRFSNIAPGQAISDSAFKFRTPAGVEIIEARDVTGG